MYATHLRRSRDFARDAHARHPHPFWARRAETEIDAPARLDEASLVTDPEVRSAFDALKEGPGIDLVLDDRIQSVQLPLIRGREIVLEDAMPIGKGAIRFLGNVDLLKLAQMTGQHGQVPDLFDAYCRELPPVSLPALLSGLALLVAKRILKPRV